MQRRAHQPGAGEGDQDQQQRNRNGEISLALDALYGTEEWYVFALGNLLLAIAGCLYWLYALDIVIERKGFTLACYFWMAHSAASLSTIRRNRAEAEKRRVLFGPNGDRMGTNASYYQVLAAFTTAVCITFGGWYIMPIAFMVKGYLGMSAVHLVGATFTYANTVRNRADATHWRAEVFRG